MLDAGYRKDNVVSKIECLILGLFFGFGPPIFCLLTTFIITAILFGTEVFGPWTLCSLVPGAVLDVIFLKSWVKKAYRINSKALASLYIFYSIGALGFCMGIPILNFVLGMAAGAYAARKMYHTKAGPEEFNRNVKKISIFAAAVMALMCCLITLWAIAGQMIGYKFETPWLSFTFTVPIFWTVVFIGGTFLVLLQYWLTRTAAKVAFRLSR